MVVVDLIFDNLLVIVYCWLLDNGCLFLVVCCCLFIDSCLLMVVVCLLIFVC